VLGGLDRDYRDVQAIKAEGRAATVGAGVAVAGWQWWQSIAGIKAVILVLVTTCGCGYWLRGSGLKTDLNFF
jgi:hypothetical protein